MASHAHNEPESDAVLRVKAIEQLLTEKELIDPAAIDAIVDLYENRIGPRNGAQVVARAWSDAAYKARLLRDASAAIAEFGYTGAQGEDMVVLENTAEVHNVVVCTLCSCYPRAILGIPPDWYKSKAYRARAVRDPRGVLREFGLYLDARTVVHVVDSTAEMRYFVIPTQPPGTEGMSEEGLAGLVSRDSLIGAAQVRLPKKGGSRTTTEPLS